MGTPRTRIAVASLALVKIDAAPSSKYNAVAPYPGKILAGEKLKKINHMAAPAMIKESFTSINSP